MKAYGRRRLSQAVWMRRVELIRFVLVGTLNFLLTYPVYLLLLRFVVYSVAYTFSYLVGIFAAYWLNSHFVFQERMRLSKALQFPFVYVVQYFVTIGFLYLLIESAHVKQSLAPIATLLVTVPLTYVLSRYVIKRNVGSGEERRDLP